jgi:hypothetical protein
MKPYSWANHDVGITSVKVSKTIVGQGYSMSINVTVFNYGNGTENINVIVYANTAMIGEINNITIAERSSITLTFTWNTTGFAKGNYTIWAYAWPVPGETDTADNTFVDGWVIVSMVGDITGPTGWPDGKVDIRDVAKVSRIYGTLPGMPGWDPNCDINNDQKIDIKDVAAVSKQYGKIDP